MDCGERETLGVATRSHRGVAPGRPANLLLFTIHSCLKVLEVHFDCAGSQNLVGRGGCLSRLRSRCGAARIFGHGGHFSWQAEGKRALVAQSRLFVTGARGRSGFILRNADFVVGFRDRCSIEW